MALFNVYEAKSDLWIDVVAAPTLTAAVAKAVRDTGRTDIVVVENTPIVFIWPESKS